MTRGAANKAKTAALAAYPGGTVDRVVLLSNGEYSSSRSYEHKAALHGVLTAAATAASPAEDRAAMAVFQRQSYAPGSTARPG